MYAIYHYSSEVPAPPYEHIWLTKVFSLSKCAPELVPMPTTGQSDRLGTINSASPLPVSPPGGDVQHGASSTAVFSSSSSALNRRHWPMASTLPVSVQPSTLVINTLDPQSVPPSVQVVVIPETTANQPTTVPEVQRTVPNATQGRTCADPCHPSISSGSALPARHEIRMDGHSPSLVRHTMSINDVEASGHNDLAGLPQENSTSGSYHTE